jgi:hypothetical protein
MPPLALFQNRRRPNDLIFPSCVACNHGSKDLDQIVAFLARLHRAPAAGAETEPAHFIRAMRNNYPEVYTAVYPVDPPPVPLPTSAPKGPLVNVNDPYIHHAIALFSAKLGFALHWRETGRVVSLLGGAAGTWFTNWHAVAGRIPSGLLEAFPEPQTLRQGERFSVRNQLNIQRTQTLTKGIRRTWHASASVLWCG